MIRRLSILVTALGVVTALALGACACLAPVGCTERHGSGGPQHFRVYPPPPQPPRVVALGNLRAGRTPSHTEVELARFFFGVEPEPAAGLIKPTTLAMSGDAVLVCDAAFRGVLRLDAAALEPWRSSERFGNPIRVESAAGDVWVVDSASRSVLRLTADGRLLQRYSTDAFAFRPIDAVVVNDELWVSNAALHRLEVFDLESTKHKRSIGRRGDGPAEFGLPLGMTRAPSGEVYIVDLLNGRVQVLDTDGRWQRSIGGPGDRVGTFGRPKDVAVGPDGTVFVSDAVAQRIHAFDPDGRLLLTFGDDGGAAGLALPNGLCTTPRLPADATVEHDRGLPFEPAYYVLVAEQLRDPGVRAFAWRSAASEDALLGPSVPQATSASTSDPHWSPSRCTACHQAKPDGSLRPIAAGDVDALCLSCHNGDDATAEAHPIGRVARGPELRIPEDWPLVDGRLGCLTCHDIRRHCDAGARRPASNAALVRGYVSEDRFGSCAQCHVADEPWRINPHDHVDAAGNAVADMCRFCHSETPVVPPDGQRRSTPGLVQASSTLCLTCHARHWDYAPGSHVERRVPASVFTRMLDVEAQLSVAQTVARLAQPVLLPLADGRVTCYTCHNPHAAGLFAPGSPLARRATSAPDAVMALRLDQNQLCLTCHGK